MSKTWETGKQGEQYVIDLFQAAGIPTKKNPDYTSLHWDLSFEYLGKTFTVEVKYDKYQAKSGNVALEHGNTSKGTASGITATTSDFWCFVFDDPTTVWITRTVDLKSFFYSQRPYRRIVDAGDGNAAIDLYRSPHILRIFRKIEPHNLVSVLEGFVNEP